MPQQLQRHLYPWHTKFRHTMVRALHWILPPHQQRIRKLLQNIWMTATEYMDEFLIQRRKAVEADPNLRITDRLTQRGVAYRLRPDMMADGFEPRIRWSTTMDSITNMISERCEMLWPDENIDREYLGIYAKARGMFYYRGRTTPIDFNAIGELASKAAVNIVIEKEGIPAVLAPYADKYRVALISRDAS